MILRNLGKSKSKEQWISDDMLLRLLLTVVNVASIFTMLFLPFVQRQDSMLAKNIGLTGIHLISSMTNGGKLQIQMSGSLADMIIPGFLTVALLSFVVLRVLSCVFGMLDEKKRKISGIFSLITSIGLIVLFFITMLFSGIKAFTLQGEERTFYELFSYNSGYLLTLIFCVAGFAIGFFVKIENIPRIKKFAFLYFLIAIPMILLFIFNFYPIFLQTVLSFKDYTLSKGIWGSSWVGLKHFITIFTDPDMGRIIWNTVYISGLRLIAGFFPPIILALMIFEIERKFLKGAIQTITYIPHFFSWIIIYGIVYAFLAPDGVVSAIGAHFGYNITDILTNESYFIPILIISAIWKELGWGTIIYLAALSSVDTEIYDAGKIDGVGPLQKIWYITLPQISGVIVFSFIMSVGNILKGAGGEQILMFANSAVMNKAEVIDTWVYWQGLGDLQYGLGAAVSFFQAAIGVVMVLAANKLSVKLVGRGMW